MRILFLTTLYPSEIGGERLRPYHIIRRLSARHDIKLLCFVPSGETGKEAAAGVDTKEIKFDKLYSWINCAGAIFTGEPFQIAYFRRRGMEDAVRKEMRENKYDIIYCHLVRMSEYARGVKDTVKVLDICDALSRRYGLSCKYRGFPFALMEYMESKRLKRYEARITDQFDMNIVSSSVDRKYLCESGAKNTFLLENGAEFPKDKRPGGPIDPDKIVMFANFRAFPNRDAVIYFYRHIFPLIKREIPAAKFAVAGTDIPACIRGAGDGSLDIYDHPSDMMSVVESACVSVAPMRIAVGVQNKILQSMAWGVPVVATSPALGGIKALPGRDIFIADQPKDFAGKVCAVLNDNKLRSTLAENAFKVAAEDYGWDNIVNKLERALEDLVARKNKRK